MCPHQNFGFFYCPNFDKIFFWFYNYMTQNMLGMTADIIPSRPVWFHCDYARFIFSFKKWIFVFFFSIFFKSVAKTYKKTGKAKKYCCIDQERCWTAYIATMGTCIVNVNCQFSEPCIAFCILQTGTCIDIVN